MPATGFPPIAAPGARVLILGSLPGAASLAAGQYYAHPRNGFWPIMGALVGAHPALPYRERCAALARAGIALWDACHAAERPGSLDAAIVAGSVVPNDFTDLFAACPRIAALFHNGAASAALYRRLVLPGLPHAWAALPRMVLPSTSPAHAGRSIAEKQALWRRALAPHVTP